MSAVTEISSAVEINVLGGLMQDNTALDRVEFLTPDMFTGAHQEIFRAIQRAADAAKPFDAISLSERMGGHLPELARIQYECFSTANVVHYSRMLEGAHLRRKVVAAASHVIELANQGTEPGDLVDAAQEAMMTLRQDTSRGAMMIGDLLRDCVDLLEQRFENPSVMQGARTGFTDIDGILHGLKKGHLYIVAGRPSMGKTTLALNIAETVSEQTPVAIFSLEMPAVELTEKFICSVGRVDYSRYLAGQPEDDEFPRVTRAASTLQDRKILIDDNGSLSITQLRSRARNLKRKHGLGLVVVDYLQLMSARGDKESRRIGIEEISRGLKALAKELDVPVVALSQLSRECEKRPNKRPVMSDLRESGSIEQDADVVMFVYRDEVYNVDSPDAGIAEILIRKNRAGKIGMTRLVFNGDKSRFDNLSAADPAILPRNGQANWKSGADLACS